MTGIPQPRGRRRRSPGNVQLSRDAWLDAASTSIAESGLDNVRILVLAEQLRVSRGSFYWHFQDHAEFIKSYLDRWKAKRLTDMAYWRPTPDDPEKELHRLIHVVLGGTPRHPNRLRIELAIRDYARRDKGAAEVLAEVDRARLSQVVPLLERIINEPAEALGLALFATVVGGQLLLAGPTIDAAELAHAVDRAVDLCVQGAKAERET